MNYIHNKFIKNLDLLLDISTKVFKCAIKRCNTYTNDTNTKLLKILKNKNLKKKEILIKKLASNKKNLKLDKCLYKKCKDIHIKLIKILIKTTKDLCKNSYDAELINNNLKLSLKKLIKLSKKSSLNSSDLKEMSKNKNILFYTILNLKPKRNYSY